MTSVRFEQEKTLDPKCAEEEQEGRKVLPGFLSRFEALFFPPVGLLRAARKKFFPRSEARSAEVSRFSRQEDVNFRGHRRAPAEIWL